MTTSEVNKLLLLESYAEEKFNKRQVAKLIERLNISADAKSILFKLATTTIAVAGKIYEVGKTIISVVHNFVSRYPKTAFNLLLVLIVSTLINMIPLVGQVLTSIFTLPALILLGFKGYSEDINLIEDRNLRKELSEMLTKLKTSHV